MTISIHQLSIGGPKTVIDYNGKQFTTSMQREEHENSVQLGFEGIIGDKATAKFHGGPNRAIHLFCLQHYEFFNSKAGCTLPIPTFGENLTITGTSEIATHIGDRYQLGSAIIEVTQPTERCKNVGRSAGFRDMLSWIHEHLYTGWYVRVIQEGEFSAQDEIKLIEQGDLQLNLDRLNRALFKKIDEELLIYCLAQPTPSSEFKERIVRLAQKQGVTL